MMRRLLFILAMLLTLQLAACDHAPSGGLPVTTIQIGPEPFNLEIATSFHDQEVGLMHRDHLDPDHGMIFPFPKPSVQTFWNHDVHFPLDLLFLDETGKIVSIKQMEAYSDKNTSSDVPAQYVIELNKGTADHLHIKVGDAISLPRAVILPATTTTSPSA